MAVRGRPERPHTAGSQGTPVYGLGDGRGAEIEIGLTVVRLPFNDISLGLYVTTRTVAEVELGCYTSISGHGSVDLGLSVMEITGDERVRYAAALGLTVGHAAGASSAPRVITPDSVPVGQEVQRGGRIIPCVD